MPTIYFKMHNIHMYCITKTSHVIYNKSNKNLYFKLYKIINDRLYNQLAINIRNKLHENTYNLF